jgi:hypothetical protein
MSNKLLLLLLCGVITSAIAQTQHKIYTWIDAQGTTHFSDQPNPNAKEIEVRVSSSVGALNQSSTAAQTSHQKQQSPQPQDNQNSKNGAPQTSMPPPGMMNNQQDSKS